MCLLLYCQDRAMKAYGGVEIKQWILDHSVRKDTWPLSGSEPFTLTGLYVSELYTKNVFCSATEHGRCVYRNFAPNQHAVACFDVCSPRRSTLSARNPLLWPCLRWSYVNLTENVLHDNTFNTEITTLTLERHGTLFLGAGPFTSALKGHYWGNFLLQTFKSVGPFHYLLFEPLAFSVWYDFFFGGGDQDLRLSSPETLFVNKNMD